MPDDLDRREADQTFKYKIVEQLAEIKGDVKEIKEGNKNHEGRIRELESVLWGQGAEKIGLLEKHRSLLRTWAIIIAVGSFAAAAVARIISPLYDKAIADWAFNSPAEKWIRETSQPKVTVYKIYRRQNPVEGTK